MGAFPLDIRTELSIDGTWQNISPDVYVRDVKQITRGLRDQGSAADPSSLTLTLNNRAGKYSPRNALSPMYGKIGQNTQVRLSVPAAAGADHYLQLDGDQRHYVSTPDTAALDITGDLDVRAELTANWYGAPSQIVIGKWDRANLQQSWQLSLFSGYMYLLTSPTGDEYTSIVWARAKLPVLPDRAAIRATLDVSNADGNREFRFYWATSLDGAWTQIGDPFIIEGAGSIFSGSAPLQVGVYDPRDGMAVPRVPLTGLAYRFEVRSGIDGTIVAAPDFRALSAGTTSFSDSAGRPWTVSPGAEIRDRADRFVGEISAWPLKWTTDDIDVWTPVTASGVMRRLGQGQKALDSTLRRRIPTGKPIAYWPMEESQFATRAYSPIAGVLPASVTGVEWASMDTLPSSAPLPKLTEECGMSAPVPAATPGQWQVEFVYNADKIAPVDPAEVIRITTVGSPISLWTIEMQMGLAIVSGWTPLGVRSVWQGVSVGGDVFNGWTRLRFWVRNNTGGGFDWRVSWQDVGGESGGVTKNVATGSAGAASVVSGNWPAALAGWGFGHLAVFPTAGVTTFDGSDDAYLGESAWSRIFRVSYEEGIPVSRKPGRLPVAEVGFQRQDTLLNLLEDAAGGDGGMLTEDMSRVGLRYRDRSSLYTQAPALTLSYTAPGLGPDIEPVDDDSGTANDVTVTRDGGSSARAVQETGPLGVDTIGRYDTSYTLSLANDDQVDDVAFWKLHLGTFDGARYPSVSVMLHKPGAESLIPAVLALREGDVIRLTNLPKWVSNDDVDLIVCGWTETLDVYRWEFTFNCAPGGPWLTAITDDTTYGKADTDGSVLAAAATATDTALRVRTTAGPQWTTAPADMPFYVTVSGEKVRVNSVVAAGLDTFTGRTVSNSWGTAESGQAWVTTSATPAADVSVSGGVAKHTHTTKNIFHMNTLNVGVTDVETLTKFTVPVMPTGDPVYVFVMARSDQNGTNMYFARLAVLTTGKVELTLRKRIPAETAIATWGTLLDHVAGDSYRVRLSVSGSTIRARLWKEGTTEPATWALTVTDTSITSGTYVGCRSLVQTANTNASPVVVSFDDVQVTDVQTFTVDRSMNGIAKAQPAGTPVSIAVPAITSL